MSRLIVKGLTKNIDEKKLFSLFSNHGTITDLKLFKNKNGSIRNYFFIGFLEKESSKKIIQTFDGAFISNQKITIEEALPKFSNEITPIFTKKDFLFQSTENVSETGLLFVRNIASSCKINELYILFSKFGYLEFIKMPFKSVKNILSIYAFIKFSLPECAVKAAMILDGKIFKGRILHIISGYKLFSNLNKNTEISNFNKFKKIKFNLQYNNFFNHKSWFSLFIPETAIFKCLFAKFGKANNLISNYNHLKMNTGKQVISEGRLQIEAHLILKKEGINLSSFDPNKINFRSKKTILIKNFSIYSRKDLDFILFNLGKIKKYIVLQFTSLIIIQFEKKICANLAFKILQKFEKTNKNIIIQWAPLYCFEPNNIKVELSDTNSLPNIKFHLPWFKREELNLKDLEKNILNSNDKTHKNFKILIRNIPFSTSFEELKNIFKKFEKIISIRIPKKKNGQNRGFGFLEFFTLDQAKKALVLIQNIHIKNRHLSCSLLS
jgi:multiple RNA-binding domain-containing protein 1